MSLQRMRLCQAWEVAVEVLWQTTLSVPQSIGVSVSTPQMTSAPLIDIQT